MFFAGTLWGVTAHKFSSVTHGKFDARFEFHLLRSVYHTFAQSGQHNVVPYFWVNKGKKLQSAHEIRQYTPLYSLARGCVPCGASERSYHKIYDNAGNSKLSLYFFLVFVKLSCKFETSYYKLQTKHSCFDGNVFLVYKHNTCSGNFHNRIWDRDSQEQNRKTSKLSDRMFKCYTNSVTCICLS